MTLDSSERVFITRLAGNETGAALSTKPDHLLRTFALLALVLGEVVVYLVVAMFPAADLSAAALALLRL